MAFAVEDGSVVTGANSYADVTTADTYHSDRGNSSWSSLSTPQKQAALIKATDYIDQEYGPSFIGEQYSEGQALEWPRSGLSSIGYDEIPDALIQAVCLLALEASTTDLNPSLARGGAVKREKVDVVEVEYMDGAPSQTVRPAISGLLRKLIVTGLQINGKSVRV